MDERRISADAGFSQVIRLICIAVESEKVARREPGCGGLLKMADKHRADAEVLLWDGLIETQP